MGLTFSVRNFASAAPVPVFAVAGSGRRRAVQDLRLATGIELVDSPAAAAILLVAGDVGADRAEALAGTHDAIPAPRATVTWAGTGVAGLIPAAAVDAGDDPVPVLRAIFRDLLTGRRASEPAVLPDVDPAPWRGIGPYGQGGTGMTGGVPYGRPMAELGPDRDGLRLDVLPLAVGPFFPGLPPGLTVDVQLAGDLVIEAAIAASETASPSPPGSGSPFRRALLEPVPVAELEMDRARDHLRLLAEALRVQGLGALGIRALRLAHEVRPGEGDRVRRFGRQLSRTGLFRWSLSRGVLDTAAMAGLGLGPVGRAGGLREDARMDDPAYRDLGFEPLVGERSDASGRWRLRLEEAARALDLAAAAGNALTRIQGRVESPRGRLEPGDAPTSRLLPLVSAALVGLEWGDALATLIGLDLDPDEVTSVASVPAAHLRATG